MPTSTSDLAAKLKSRAAVEGFEECRITSAEVPTLTGERLRQFVAEGCHGDMTWLADTLERRVAPRALWPQARSAIVLALSYAPDADPMTRLGAKSTGNISVYALGRDYHDVLKGKLKRLAQWFARAAKAEVKVFVDTAPLMEKPLAAMAGIGWQGKHTNLVSRRLGSWFFLGVILTDAELPTDEAETDHCGNCHACLDICPTRAFPAPYRLDARRCISYLTIEHESHIAREFRPAMGNRIFGCDDCLAVCPWNKFAQAGREAKLFARDELKSPRLADLLELDGAGFRRFFAASAVKRTGRDRFVRNALIAAGNSGDESLVPQVKARLADASPLVRAMAVWALSQLSKDELTQERSRRLAQEDDATVREEWSWQ
jgi:epoxyqueuosine reductase